MGTACDRCRPNAKSEQFIKEIMQSIKFNDWNYLEFIDLLDKFLLEKENISDISGFSDNHDSERGTNDKLDKKLESAVFTQEELIENGRFSIANKSDNNRSQTKIIINQIIFGKLKKFIERNFCSISLECKWFMYHTEILPELDLIVSTESNFLVSLFSWVMLFLKPINLKEKYKDFVNSLYYIYGNDLTRKHFEKFLSQMIEYCYLFIPRKIIKFTLKEYKINKGIFSNSSNIDSDLHDQLNLLYSDIFTKQNAFEFLCMLFDKINPFLKNDKLGKDDFYKAAEEIEQYLYFENILDNGFYLYSLKI